MPKEILKVLVGSRAHGLNTESSDWDYRGCFIVPTSEILSLGYKEKATSWLEGQGEDATAYELHHFLNLATHSNPSILEVLVSPVVEETIEGRALTELFPALWNSKDVLNAFGGYSANQRKKFLEEKDGRPWKFAAAYIRVLLLGIELLRYKTMSVDLMKQEHVFRGNGDSVTASGYGCAVGALPENLRDALYCVKTGKVGEKDIQKGLVVDWAESLTAKLKEAYEQNPNKVTDVDRVNDFLLKARKANW